MQIHLGVEDIEPNNWVAWAFELPGCYSRGKSVDEAMSEIDRCVRAHIDRLTSLGIWTNGPVTEATPITYEIIERHSSFPVDNGDYLVNAFFEDDRRPIEQSDLVNGLALMLLNRIELVNTV